MGKRRQRTKWCSVEWCQDNQTGSPPPDENRTKRTSKSWRTSSLPPRFESKGTAAEKHILYEEEIYEAEELQDGFTKITSKNLDILFKREYYEQEKTSLEDPKKCTEESCIDKTEEKNFKGEMDVQTNDKSESEKSLDNLSQCNTSLRSSFDQINLSDIQEFQPMNSFECFPDMTCHPYSNSSSYQNQDLDSPQPCLYLYSPSENSLIPCEEIIIPNHGMSPEYPGTTNIYLAYSDGRGYITHQYTPPSSYMSQDSAYSTTPQDSGPTSPPTLANYHPTNTDMLEKDTRDGASNHETTTVQETVRHIPGLIFKEDKNQKKSMRKRRRNLKGESYTEDTSTCQDSDLHEVDNQITDSTPPSHGAVPEEDEPIQEIHLTDDLANCLVNPPTDTDKFAEYSQMSQDMLTSDVNTENNEDGERAQNAVAYKLPRNTSDDSPETEKTPVDDWASDILTSMSSDTKDVVHEKINLSQHDFVKPKSGNVVHSKRPKRKFKNKKNELCLQMEEVEDISLRTCGQSGASVEKSYSSVVKSCSEEIQNLSSESLHSNALSISNQASHDILENESDNFVDKSAVPSSENWIRRTVKRRKQKNRVNNHETIAVEDTVIESEPLACTEDIVNAVEDSKEDVTHEENNNEVVKKKHRKKKKKSSEDLDSRSDVRKVMICDDQVEIHSQPLMRETSLLATSFGMLKFSGYDNCLIVSELGSGISRGSMNNGRPYQGKYIPPDRTDGVPVWCQEIEEISEDISTTSTDIDLD